MAPTFLLLLLSLKVDSKNSPNHRPLRKCQSLPGLPLACLCPHWSTWPAARVAGAWPWWLCSGRYRLLQSIPHLLEGPAHGLHVVGTKTNLNCGHHKKWHNSIPNLTLLDSIIRNQQQQTCFLFPRSRKQNKTADWLREILSSSSNNVADGLCGWYSIQETPRREGRWPDHNH